MKLQHLMIIFAVIFLPIILITSYYIQKQVSTIDLQLSYDTKLADATSDAMYAFEINTANEDLSSVADSLRTIIEASNNIFLNTLATNLGYSNASQSYIKPYIPSVLYTLYDGYYLYAPTASPEVLTDKYGQTVSVGDYGVSYVDYQTKNGKKIGYYKFTQDSVVYSNDSTTATNGDTVTYNTLEGYGIEEEYGQLLYKTNRTYTYNGKTYYYYTTTLNSDFSNSEYNTYYSMDYILKSYISYSAHYTHGSDIDINVNYTLDNFVTITGTINGIYYSKSGYLIASSLVSDIKVITYNSDGSVNTSTSIDWYTYSDEEIIDLINSDDVEVVITLKESSGTETTLSNRTTYELNSTTISSVQEDIRSAMEYYATSWMFSSWVNTYLSTVQAKDITNSWGFSSSATELSGSASEFMDSMIADFTNDNTYIFKLSASDNDPENDESDFTNHKRSVIKNSIVYNLALALVNYGDMRALESYDFPMFSGEEWDSILSNVSIVSFMQGFSCGLKTYNGYAIATSTNNEISVTTSEIYYVPITEFDADDGDHVVTDLSDAHYSTNETAHRIDCSGLADVDYYISFVSKEVKYDKIYNKDNQSYVYDHKAYLAYDCIVNSNYLYTSSGTLIRGLLTDIDGVDGAIANGYMLSTNKIRAYRIATAKERNNLYKPTAVSSSYGYEVNNDNNNSNVTLSTYSVNSTGKGQEIYKVEIVVTNIKSKTSNVYTDKLTLNINGDDVATQTIAVSSTSSTTLQTFVFENFTTAATGGNGATLKFSFSNAEGTIKSVKIYYK